MNGLFNLDSFDDLGDEEVLESNSLDDLMNAEIDENVMIPGGDNERPANAPKDDSIPIPSKTNITADQYNDALSSLQKSFKEGVEILQMLKEANVISDIDSQQNAFTENAMYEALVYSYENGPIFERVDRDDKDEVKGIVTKIRKTVAKACRDNDIQYYKPALLVSIILGLIFDGSSFAKAFNGIWSNRIWQIVGCVIVNSGQVEDVKKSLNKTYAEELEGYQLLLIETSPNIVDCFRMRFNWKNNEKVYWLIVDKKVSDEFKKDEKELDTLIKKGKEAKEKKGKKEDKEDKKEK